jgi:DNA-directed RNA polymerase specialized sigma24 family protein
MAPRPDHRPVRSYEEDLELSRRCGSGDPAAQRAFVDRFAVLVHSLCARSGIVGPDREDVAQQVLLDAFRALPRYRGTSRLSTWIYSLALRRVADHFRSPQRRDVPSGWPGDDSFPPPQSTPVLAPDEQAVRRDEDQRVKRALAVWRSPSGPFSWATIWGRCQFRRFRARWRFRRGPSRRASIGDVRCCANNWARGDLRSISRSLVRRRRPRGATWSGSGTDRHGRAHVRL